MTIDYRLLIVSLVLSLPTDIFALNNGQYTHRFDSGTIDPRDKWHINTPYGFPVTVSNTTNYVANFHYSIKDYMNKSHAIRVFVTSPNATARYPILFVIKQQLGILSWQIPLTFDNVHNYLTVNRTLCPVWNYFEAKQLKDDQEVIVDVSTSSPDPVNVNVELMLHYSFLLEVGVDHTIKASPSQPQYYEARFPENTEVIVVTVTSEDEICTIVSIQPIGCPVYDLDKNVQFTGVYQTMTKKAAVTLRKKDYETGKFYVVVVVKATDYECIRIGVIEPAKSGQPELPRSKNLTIRIDKKIGPQEYLLATVGAAAIFIVFYVFSVTVSIVYLVKNYRRNGDIPVSQMERNEDSVCEHLTTENGAGSYGSIQANKRRSMKTINKTNRGASPDDDTSPSLFGDEDEDEAENLIDEDEIDMLHDADSDKNVVRTKTFLYVADLARKDCKVLDRKSKLYLCNMITIAVFYALPVVQLVITYQSVQNVTGNQDICYYNFQCTYPVRNISDFNHVFSNVGYLMLGFLFICLVWRRDLLHKQQIALDDEYEKYYGIPRHFGLFYAMGLALMMEGILSGCYHVCPNYSNFQFDTAFMYMIAGLCMLKVYQTRHPDINASAYASCMAFAFIVLIGVIGVVYGTPVFWIGFAVIHILSTLALSAQIYYMGMWRLNLGIFKRIYLTMKTDLLSETHCFRPMYTDRIILLTMVNAVNWSFSIYGLIYQPRNFASFLLAIFIVNLLMYVAFYIIMKMRFREKILPLPLIYIVLSIVTWTAALFFFEEKSTSWELTPAQSRTYNKPCMILNFYDDHDVWHFLSAASMFFSFMILLTLDDDLVQTSRTEIPVF